MRTSAWTLQPDPANAGRMSGSSSNPDRLKRALIFGANGGIGHAITRALCSDARYGDVYAASRTPRAAVDDALPLLFDLHDEASIAGAVAAATQNSPLDLVFVATGVLHDATHMPEKTYRALDGASLEQMFRTNAIGPALVAKHVLPHLAKDRKAVFAAISARVGSISDNRLGGWHSYRASKAALNMLVKTMSIELGRTHPKALCVTLHPGTVDTSLSKPFQGNLAADRLFSPEQSATSLLGVIDALDASHSGGLFAWDGQALPF